MQYALSFLTILIGTLKICWLCTLDYLISVGVCLLIFPRFSTQHALIPYHTFINPRPLLLMKTISIVFQSNFNIFSAFFGLKYRFDVIFKVKFPPNMIIPYPMFILLPGNFHPIPLFHTVRLFDRLKYLLHTRPLASQGQAAVKG